MKAFEELTDEQDAPPFRIRHAGKVTMLEATKGVDWLSMFPSEPGGEPGALVAVDPAPLIDLPPFADPPPLADLPPLPDLLPLAEVVTPVPVDDSPAGPATAVPFLPGTKRPPFVAMVVPAAALVATATILYLFLIPPRVGNVSASDAPLTMQPLAPADDSTATPTPTPVAPTPVAPTPAAPAPPRRTPTPTPAARVQTPATPAYTMSRTAAAESSPASTTRLAPTIEATPPPAAAPAPLLISAPTPGAGVAARPVSAPLTSPRPSAASVPSPSPTNTTAVETAAVRSTLDQYRAAYRIAPVGVGEGRLAGCRHPCVGPRVQSDGVTDRRVLQLRR